MHPSSFIQLFQSTPLVQQSREWIAAGDNLQLKGLSGSYDAILSAALTTRSHSLYVMYDREDAMYYRNDLQNFFDDRLVVLFPTSSKKPYEFVEIENANVLQRAEVLNLLSGSTESLHIVTYPEALIEKVINQRSLQNNTFTIHLADKLSLVFLDELLLSYDFEKTDFVYEPGQFAIRGGIIDIFSFSSEFPIRIEFFGDKVEALRKFDPESQLSNEPLEAATLTPNIQQKLFQEQRQSLLDFLPADTTIWIKDHRSTLDIMNKGFHQIQESFHEIMDQTNPGSLITQPETMYLSGDLFETQLKNFQTIEFGHHHYLPGTAVSFDCLPQPHFHKNFDLLAREIHKYQQLGYAPFITSTSSQQLDRLDAIFSEIQSDLSFKGLSISLRGGFIDRQNEILCFTDHQIFDRFQQVSRQKKFSKNKALTLRELQQLFPGDFVVHSDYGVGRFAGLDTVKVGVNYQEAVRLVYRDDDLLYVSIHSLHKISKYVGREGEPPAINKLGTQEWETKKKRVKRKVKDIAKELIQLYAKRKEAKGFAFAPDDYLQAELESSFLYQDTPDQAEATRDVKKDMEKPYPMDRLVCGDVGFGKTEIAIRAAFKAVNNGKQVVVLVPTTILAMQHYRTFSSRLENFGITIDFINRFRSGKEITAIKKSLAQGHIDILIGTHRVVNKDMDFKDLGLMIIDEEQKFGVRAKEKLKEKRVNIDSLTLTATPIPRTLHFSLMGARDLSVISTPPPNRRPVTTELHSFSKEVIRDAVRNELRRGGQVFLVHNRISDIEQLGNLVIELVPDARVAIAHGQMEGAKLEKVMLSFIEGNYDVLVSTNIIESGLDIPNANTIIINRAQMFGLSDLHQMRGRVGRSNAQAHCFLLTPPVSQLTSDARKRLLALEEFSELGDGFKIAMRDLDIRGAGDLLGSEQSGFITDMGFDMYHKILDEAVAELKEEEFKDIFADVEKTKALVPAECIMETDLDIRIPETYIQNISERLRTYTELDNLTSEEELNTYLGNLQDRFGQLPESLNNLIVSVHTRWKAMDIGFHKLIIKNGQMKGYISGDDEVYINSSRFGLLLKYIQRHASSVNMKESGNRLIIQFSSISDMSTASRVLEEILQEENIAV